MDVERAGGLVQGGRLGGRDEREAGRERLINLTKNGDSLQSRKMYANREEPIPFGSDASQITLITLLGGDGLTEA